MLTFIAWCGWRVFQRRRSMPSDTVIVFAIFLSALAFAAAHLPIAFATLGRSPDIVARVMLANAIAGLVFGWLYWRRSLEAAMLAHAILFALALAFV